MRILHVASAFDVDFPGGITNYVRTLASSQVAAGDDVFVLDGSKSRAWCEHPLGFKVQGSGPTEVDNFVASMPADPKGSSELMELILENQFDVVHFHLTIGIGTSFYSWFAGAGVNYVISLHDYYLYCPRIMMMDFTGNDCGGPAPRKCEVCVGKLDQIDLLYRASRKTGVPLPRIRSKKVTVRNAIIEGFFRNATVILAVSNRVRELYQSVYPEGNYVVSHIGSTSASVARPAKTEYKNLRLTFIGTLARFKGAEVLEQIALGLTRRDVEIQFFGRIDRAEWGPRIARAGVTLRGSYTPDDLPEIMSNTDVGLVLPVWEDNAPQVVMEFLNYGIPVVATSMGGIPDFVSGVNGFLFDPRSEAGVRSAISFLDSLDVREARKQGQTITRLTEPGAHQAQVRSLYSGAATPGQV
jgi:glycosyltransferase involved in cell wall biosynthesis